MRVDKGRLPLCGNPARGAIFISKATLTEKMNIIFLKKVFVILIILFLIVLALLFIFYGSKTEVNGFKEITGTVVTYEVVDSSHSYHSEKTDYEYNEKYLSYLDSVQNSRDKTFMR